MKKCPTCGATQMSPEANEALKSCFEEIYRLREKTRPRLETRSSDAPPLVPVPCELSRLPE
jgi:hypothetical protein